MKPEKVFEISDLEKFKKEIYALSSSFSHFSILDSNNLKESQNLGEYEFMAALGARECFESNQYSLEILQNHLSNGKKWWFGGFSYSLTEEIYPVPAFQAPRISFPNSFFFHPMVLVLIQKNQLDKATILGNANLLNTVLNEESISNPKITMDAIIDKNGYLDKIGQIRDCIEEGLFYELNFCQEFYKEGVNSLNTLSLYKQMRNDSPTPFSAYMNYDGKYLLSCSPERFLVKKDKNVFTQPIKGTIKRGATKKMDEKLKESLLENEKERAENVMIVDLCRNDLKKVCKTGSVKVTELFGIYSYQYVHQMISTVRGELQENVSFPMILDALFPMGSMTGAPKFEVIKNINKLEESGRGLYSGSVGYIDPKGDFDFNVVIRSLIYDKKEKVLSYHVGGAITYDSIALKEYEECLLKAESMNNVL